MYRLCVAFSQRSFSDDSLLTKYGLLSAVVKSKDIKYKIYTIIYKRHRLTAGYNFFLILILYIPLPSSTVRSQVSLL